MVEERGPGHAHQPSVHTGRQVWNERRTDEILRDVDDLATGRGDSGPTRCENRGPDIREAEEDRR
jgi:hypothetical protein